MWWGALERREGVGVQRGALEGREGVGVQRDASPAQRDFDPQGVEVVRLMKVAHDLVPGPGQQGEWHPEWVEWGPRGETGSAGALSY